MRTALDCQRGDTSSRVSSQPSRRLVRATAPLSDSRRCDHRLAATTERRRAELAALDLADVDLVDRPNRRARQALTQRAVYVTNGPLDAVRDWLRLEGRSRRKLVRIV